MAFCERSALAQETTRSPEYLFSPIMSGKGKGGRTGKGKGKKGASGKSRSAKAGIQFPVGKVGRLLKKGGYAKRIGAGAPVYLAAVLEYVVAETLELAGNAARDNKRSRISPRHIQLAIRNDEELSKYLAKVTIAEGGVLQNIHQALVSKSPKQRERRCVEIRVRSPEGREILQECGAAVDSKSHQSSSFAGSHGSQSGQVQGQKDRLHLAGVLTFVPQVRGSGGVFVVLEGVVGAEGTAIGVPCLWSGPGSLREENALVRRLPWMFIDLGLLQDLRGSLHSSERSRSRAWHLTARSPWAEWVHVTYVRRFRRAGSAGEFGEGGACRSRGPIACAVRFRASTWSRDPRRFWTWREVRRTLRRKLWSASLAAFS